MSLVVTAALGLAFVSGVSAAQTGRKTSTIAANRPASLPVQLEAPTWTQRAKVFLAVPEKQWATSGMKEALLALLAREDSVIVATLVESSGKLGVSDKYGEEYSEYYGTVLGTCISYCDRTGLLSLMLNHTRPGSEMRFDTLERLGRYAMRFSMSQRPLIDSALISGVADTNAFIQQGALNGLGMLLRTDRQLAQERRDRIHRALQAATADEHSDVRESAVGRLALFADPVDVPLLTTLAERDGARTTSRGVTTYPVREAARKAIAKIRGKP
jgi:hypothetical protein